MQGSKARKLHLKTSLDTNLSCFLEVVRIWELSSRNLRQDLGRLGAV